jgi:dihydrofolate reductase
VRKLFLQMVISVDGYFDGPNQELDWFVIDDEYLAYVDEMLRSIDGILLGRTTYEHFAAHWPNSTQAEAGAMNALPKFVASTTLTDATWSNTTIIADDVPNAVARMKKEPGKDLVIIGSSVLATTLAAHGLIDEYRFFVVPVLLGRGTRVLDGLPERLALTLRETRASGSGVIAQYYTPAGAGAGA